MSNTTKQKCSICGAPDHTHLHCYGTDAQRPVSSNRKTVPDFFGRLYPTNLVNGSFLGTWVRRAEVDALLDEIERLHIVLKGQQEATHENFLEIERLRAMHDAYVADAQEEYQSLERELNDALGVSSDDGSQVETKPKCAKPGIHHPACDCLERESRDAARYRFLRNPGHAIIYAKDRNAWGKNCSGHVRYDTAAELDAAVDAALGSSAEETSEELNCTTCGKPLDDHGGMGLPCPLSAPPEKATTEGRPLTHAEAAVVEAFSDELTTIYRCKCGSLPGTSIRGQMYCTNCGNYRADKPGPQVKASTPHVHIWIDDDGVAVCSDCKETADDWFCPTSPTKLCRYTRTHDACDFCGQPEERK